MKQKINKIIALAAICLIPFYLFLVRITNGYILPSISSMRGVWNIQYAAPASVSIVTILFLLINKKLLASNFIYYIAIVLNIIYTGLFLFLILDFWGEKY